MSKDIPQDTYLWCQGPLWIDKGTSEWKSENQGIDHYIWRKKRISEMYKDSAQSGRGRTMKMSTEREQISEKRTIGAEEIVHPVSKKNRVLTRQWREVTEKRRDMTKNERNPSKGTETTTALTLRKIESTVATTMHNGREISQRGKQKVEKSKHILTLPGIKIVKLF